MWCGTAADGSAAIVIYDVARWPLHNWESTFNGTGQRLAGTPYHKGQGVAYVILPRAIRMHQGCSKTLWVKSVHEFNKLLNSKFLVLWTLVSYG